MAKENCTEAAKPENGVSQEAPTLSQSDIGQSPILTVIRKRLRAANKRLKRIEDIEGARAAGKTLDADQEESLRSKPKVLANIEELERLQPLLREARSEDKGQIEAACKAHAVSEAQAASEEASASRIAELEASKEAAEQQAASARAEAEAARSEAAQLQSSAQGAQAPEAAVHRLVELMYFAAVFADDGAHHHEAERKACVSYNYDFAGSKVEGRHLSEEDLKLVARLGNLLTQRPQGPRGQTMNHKDVIDSCAEAAMGFLQKSSDTIPDLDASAEQVAEILGRVLSLDYARVTPQVQTARQPEHEIAPHHHAGPAPTHNGFFEQRGPMPYSASEAPPHSANYAPAPEPSAAHYAAIFQPAATDHPMHSAHQEAPQEAPYYASAPAADLPIQFMTESTVEMEGGHPDPMGAAAKEPMPSSIEPSAPARTILQSLQGETASAPQAASGQAPPTADGPRGFDGRGGRHRGNARGGSFSRGGRDERGRAPPRGRGPPGPRASADLGPRSASGDYRGGRGGSARRGGPRGGGRGGPTAQAVPQQA